MKEQRRWAAAERTKCLSDTLLSWRLYQLPRILWRDFQSRREKWRISSGAGEQTGAELVKVRIRGEEHVAAPADGALPEHLPPPSRAAQVERSSWLDSGQEPPPSNPSLHSQVVSVHMFRVSAVPPITTTTRSTFGSFQLERQTAAIDLRRWCLKVGQVLQSLIYQILGSVFWRLRHFSSRQEGKPEDVGRCQRVFISFRWPQRYFIALPWWNDSQL